MKRKNAYLLVLTVMCLLSVHMQAQNATFEGVMKMYIVNEEGDAREVDVYEQTDCEQECLVFVVEMPETDVSQFLDEENKELLSSAYQTDIRMVFSPKYDRKAFAAKYANRRVRVTGNLDVPRGGWRNATEVVMKLKKIRVL